MRKERTTLPVSAIAENRGQLPWMRRNPRQWTKDDVRRTAASIREDPDFLEERPLCVVPHGDGYIVFAGNLRLNGAREAGLDTVPAVVHYPATDADRETVLRRAMKDNGSFGSWDFDTLANEWDDLPLQEWGVPAWNTGKADALSTKGREGDADYQAFVDKFDADAPLTTDDCYTPADVYECIRQWFADHIYPVSADEPIVRPFYPGGDYKKFDYPENCIVLDNPPFSIYSEIVRWYTERGIRFFLFGPQLTLLVQGADVCYLPLNVTITYENGAKVNTGFVTNFLKSYRIYLHPGLKQRIAEIQKTEPTMPVFVYPDTVVTSALLGKIGSNCHLAIEKSETCYIKSLDAFNEMGKDLFGGGLLLSRAAAEQARAAAEQARAAAEQARAVRIELSPKEQAIVDRLSTEDYDDNGNEGHTAT